MNALTGLYTQLSRVSTQEPLQDTFTRNVSSKIKAKGQTLTVTKFYARVWLVLDVGCAANWLQMP